EQEVREEAVEAALEALASLALPESLQLLEDVARSSTSKAQQKIARRSLFRIRSAHPDLAALIAPIPTPEARSPLSPPEFKVLHALTTFIDGSGTRLFFVARAQPMGRVRGAFIRADDLKGIHVCQTFDVSRKVMGPFVEENIFSEKKAWIEIPPAAWKALVEEYRHWNMASNSSVPEEVFQVMSLLDKVGEPPSRPLIYQELDEDANRNEYSYLLARSPRLFEVEEFRGWFFPSPVLQAYLQELEDIEKGAIIISEILKRERREAICQKAMLEIFDPGAQQRFKRRLEEMAYFLCASGRKEEAQMAFAAALAFGFQEEEKLRENPWALEMVDRSIAFAREEETAQPPESSITLPKLVIDPFCEQGR
ncbi:MAG: hypothetical protein ACE5JO_09370, partial [Candidatus Binatia bacterium]